MAVDESSAGLRDLQRLVVPRAGRLAGPEGCLERYALLDASGEPVGAVSVFFRDLLATGASASTLRSYGMDLLRWFRFLWAVGVPWDRATRVEARDFCVWFGSTVKPGKRGGGGAVNAVTGKSSPASTYAASTRAHSETVLRTFYDLHLQLGSGPVINPFPLARGRGSGRANAGHNPMEQWRNDRVGRYRPGVPQRVPRFIPDARFDEIFAGLASHRDRALVAFWISTGVRAAELLGMVRCDVDPGQQLITVVRKGSRAVQQVPASPDAFVWLRLYQAEFDDRLPRGRRLPLWWTLRRPYGQLTYHAAHRMFERVNASLGTNWTLHDLRHTAAHRMANDPQMPLTHVQWILGHAKPSTTAIYTLPTVTEAIETSRAFHARRAEVPSPAVAPPAPGYRAGSLSVLFGGTA